MIWQYQIRSTSDCDLERNCRLRRATITIPAFGGGAVPNNDDLDRRSISGIDADAARPLATSGKADNPRVKCGVVVGRIYVGGSTTASKPVNHHCRLEQCSTQTATEVRVSGAVQVRWS